MPNMLDYITRMRPPANGITGMPLEERYNFIQDLMGPKQRPPAPTSGQPGDLQFGVQDPYYSGQANNLWDLVSQQFPEASMGGIFNARNIRGSDKPSEHAYGAALDIMVGNNPLGDKIYEYLMGLQDQWGFTNVLWERPDHWNHLHVGWLY